MNISPYEIVITTGLFTVLGVLIGALISYRNALSLYNITEHNKSVSEFRNAFLPEIIYLKHNARINGASTSNDVTEFLNFAYTHRHLRAYEIFRGTFAGKERESIDIAWKQYCYGKDNTEELYWNQYSSGKKQTEEVETTKQLLLKRIECLLEYAHYK